MSEYHEKWGTLSPDVKDRLRALRSVQEELEAVDWYDQRIAVARRQLSNRRFWPASTPAPRSGGAVPPRQSPTLPARVGDLIVITTHGATGLSRIVSGSVAETVAQLSDVPVLTELADDDE